MKKNLLFAFACVLALRSGAYADASKHLSGCTDAQKAAVNAAAGEAMKRLWSTKMDYAGIGMAVDERQEYALKRKQARAQAIENITFGKNDTDISFYITAMFVNLMEVNRDIRCAPKADKECGAMRAAYVRSSERRVIQLCPGFFSSSAEQQARTIVHESAHTAGISESSGGESYCTHFTCDGGCGDGGTKVADNWSQFVHCVSGQTPDRPTAITGSAKKP